MAADLLEMESGRAARSEGSSSLFGSNARLVVGSDGAVAATGPNLVSLVVVMLLVGWLFAFRVRVVVVVLVGCWVLAKKC